MHVFRVVCWNMSIISKLSKLQSHQGRGHAPATEPLNGECSPHLNCNPTCIQIRPSCLNALIYIQYTSHHNLSHSHKKKFCPKKKNSCQEKCRLTSGRWV